MKILSLLGEVRSVQKVLKLIVVGLLVNLVCVAPVAASSQAEKEARFTEKVKAGIAKLGVGPEARVEVKLRDKTKLKGYISEISDDYFVVRDPRAGTATPVAYSQVKQIKGNNLSTGAAIAIGVAIAFGILLLIGLIAGNFD